MFEGGLLPPLPKTIVARDLIPGYINFFYQFNRVDNRLTGGDASIILRKLYDNPDVEFGEVLLLLNIILFNVARMASEETGPTDPEAIDFFNGKIELQKVSELLFLVIIYANDSPFKHGLNIMSGRTSFDDYTQGFVTIKDIDKIVNLCYRKLEQLPQYCKCVSGLPFIQRLANACKDFLSVVFMGVLEKPAEEFLDRARGITLELINEYFVTLATTCRLPAKFFINLAPKCPETGPTKDPNVLRLEDVD